MENERSVAADLLVGTAAAVAATLRRRSKVAHERAMAVILTPALLILALSAALLRAPIGITRQVGTAQSTQWKLPVTVMDSTVGGAWYLWSRDGVDLAVNVDSTVNIELDPGSGSGTFRISEIRQAAEIARACSAFRSQVSTMMESEIREGLVPSFMQIAPIRYLTCESGRVWIARR